MHISRPFYQIIFAFRHTSFFTSLLPAGQSYIYILCYLHAIILTTCTSSPFFNNNKKNIYYRLHYKLINYSTFLHSHTHLVAMSFFLLCKRNELLDVVNDKSEPIVHAHLWIESVVQRLHPWIAIGQQVVRISPWFRTFSAL